MNVTLDAATEYTRNRGWHLVPVKRGTKRPPMNGWQDLRLAVSDLPKHFANGANIGVLNGEPSDGLVDVDLDSTEAVALANSFLPRTALRHGRQSRPGSHCWYTCDPLPDTTKFQDPERPEAEGMIVELRSTGTQTVLPPSLHPDNESYTWDAEGRPTSLDGRVLLSAVSKLAAAALLVRYWPSSGSRQDTAMALAGGLLRAGWEEEGVAYFIEAVAKAAGDEEVSMRASAGKYSAKRLAADKPATGWPKLAELISETVADKLAEWLGITWMNDTPIVFGSQEEGSKTDWPEPADAEAFVGLAGDIVRTLEPETEADPHALLADTLATFGMLVGLDPHFMVGLQRHGMRVCPVIVGPTGHGRKGLSHAEIVGVYRLAIEDFSDRLTTGLSSGEGLISAVHDPIYRRETIKEKGLVTGYQEIEIDAGVKDKRLLVVEPEFGRTLRAMGRDGNTLSPVLRLAWDGERLKTMTKSPMTATGAHIVIVAHVTKEELRRHLNDTEAASGFANRFLWIAARRSKLLPDGGKIPDGDLGEIVTDLQGALDFAATVETMARDDEASALWHEVYPDLSQGKLGLFGAVVGRAEAYVMRLACIYALMDLSAVVKAEHLAAALALWGYSERTVRHVFGDATGDLTADTILQALRAQGAMTQTSIYGGIFGSKRSAERIAKALSLLVEAGLVTSQEVETTGRTATLWSAK